MSLKTNKKAIYCLDDKILFKKAEKLLIKKNKLENKLKLINKKIKELENDKHNFRHYKFTNSGWEDRL